MAAVGEAFQAECGDEAGLHSHGWAPHCKHCEGTRQRSPAEMRRGGEHVGKLSFLAHSQSTRQSVSPSVSKLVSQSVSQSGPQPVCQTASSSVSPSVSKSGSPSVSQHVSLFVREVLLMRGGPSGAPEYLQATLKVTLSKCNWATKLWLATCRSGQHHTQNWSILD